MYGYIGSMRTRPGHRDEVIARAIEAVMPLLTGEFTRQETQVAGGLGLGAAAR